MREASLWIGFLGGAVAWLLHLLAVWAIAEFGCLSTPGMVFGGAMTAVALWLIVVTIISAALATVSAVLAHRGMRTLRSQGVEGDDGLQYFLARGGAIASGLFVFIIVVQAVPIFYFLDWC